MPLFRRLDLGHQIIHKLMSLMGGIPNSSHMNYPTRYGDAQYGDYPEQPGPNYFHPGNPSNWNINTGLNGQAAYMAEVPQHVIQSANHEPEFYGQVGIFLFLCSP
jgi:hypothetical protein